MNTRDNKKIDPIWLLLFIIAVVILLANIENINRIIIEYKYKDYPEYLQTWKNT